MFRLRESGMPTWSRTLVKPLFAFGIAALLSNVAGLSAALAQTASCERYRAELASLNRSGASARVAEAGAQRYRVEIERLAGYYRSIGCDHGGLFFRPPAECGPIAGQIRTLQANYQSLLSQAADPSFLDERRRQLRAAVGKACDAATDTEIVQSAKPKGGGRLVCVRSCDGAYFPLDGQPKGSASPEAMCSALCPNAEMAVFHAPREGGIEEAVSNTGEPYMKLPNALRYRKAFDPSCACKKAGESWAKTLQKAETMIAHKKSDVLVTQALSDQMSNAMLRRPKAKRDKTDSPEVAATSGIRVIASDPETTGSIGTGAQSSPEQARKPRIIAPDIIPVPIP